MLYSFAYVIAFLDHVLIFPLKRVYEVVSRSTLLLINAVFVFFLIYSIRTGYVHRVFEGLVYAPYQLSMGYTESNVLGMSKVLSLPIQLNDSEAPNISAESVLVWDVDNQRELYSKNKEEKHAPASTTKLMTALIALDLYPLDEKLVVPGECTLVDSTRVNYPSGEIFTVKSLLYSLLVASAGDSACVLSSGSVDYNSFVDLMNVKAANYGMENTHFTNPVGLDGINGGHYSTAEDLLKLSLIAIRNPLISEIVKTPVYKIVSEDFNFSKDLRNTNDLLWEIPQTVGVKTGTTEEAGEVLIYEYKDDEKNILVLIMGSKDRFGDTKELLDWILNKYSWNIQ
ncbi:D-alanyl-D-alanine carboxypeptidase [Patescibacteria group bacterium]|nr:D-alanyl-D-alanine carboxypeptidase [Patescibacteria group bacterium]